MQTLGLNRILHEVRLGDDGRDGKADRDSHAAKRLRVLREVFVAVAHVAWIEIGIGTHGRKVERVDTGLREHEDADASCLAPDTIQVIPSWITRGAMSEERLE